MSKEIRIKIGASVDRDLATVFPSLEAAAKKARATIQAEMNAAFAATGTAAKGKLSAPTIKEFRDVEKAAKSAGEGIKTPLIRAVDSISKESRTSFGDMRKQFATLASDAEREMAKVERATRRAAAEQTNFGTALRRSLDAQTRISRGGLIGSGYMSGSAAGAVGRPLLRAGRAALGAARTIGMDLARGAGVQTDLSAMFGQGVQLESAATTLSNQSYMPGAQGAAGRRVDPGELVRQVRGVSNETAFDPTKAMEGLQAFVAKTGDLETGRKILKDMAVLSRATGANLEDVVDAAGDVANQLGDVDNKGDVLNKTMRAIAGQGKLGAVEMKDFASQMAKVAAAASKFGGKPEDNIVLMGALAQEARQRGGAASATQSATAVQSFVAQFSKGKRLEALDKFGVKYQDANGQLTNAQGIITSALQAAGASSHGGMTHFRKNVASMFADQQAQRVVMGFGSVYQRAYAGAQGSEADRTAVATKAVTDEFQRLIGASMSLSETNESFQKSMNTTEAKVQVFNNKMSETADQLRASMLPALEAVTPALISMATSAANWVDHLFGNRGAEASATAAETNLAMRDARLGRALRGQGPLENGDVTDAEQDVSTIQKDIERRKQQIAKREAFSKSNSKGGPWWLTGLGGFVGAEAFDRLSGSKEDRSVAVQEDKRRIKDQESQVKQTNDMLRQIHQRFDGVLKVQVVNGAGTTPKAPDHPGVRTGP